MVPAIVAVVAGVTGGSEAVATAAPPALEAPEEALEAWAGEAHLVDDSVIQIRPIRDLDGPALIVFHSGLSEASVFARFLSPHPHLSQTEVEHLTHVDGYWRVAFVATVAGRIVGIGRYDREGIAPRAEVAFVVADEYQGRGVGTVLLEYIAARALECGILELRCDVLTSNARMLAVFRHAGFDETDDQAGAGVTRVRIDLRSLEVAPSAMGGRHPNHHALPAAAGRSAVDRGGSRPSA